MLFCAQCKHPVHGLRIKTSTESTESTLTNNVRWGNKRSSEPTYVEQQHMIDSSNHFINVQRSLTPLCQKVLLLNRRQREV